MHEIEDTIAAIATGEASAAIGIIRISGSNSVKILKTLVPTVATRLRERHVHSGIVRDPSSGEALDEVVCFFLPGPGTATGEDTAEIQGHGGPFVMSRLLRAVLGAGARPAEPGEFTYRAFAHGRIDLTQAEAIMSLIGARSERAAKVALRQLSGDLGKEISRRFDGINTIAAHVEAGLDFPDEDLPLEMAQSLARRLRDEESALGALLDTFQLGSRLETGATIAIVGPSNAGKSSLFNKLIGDERAIVDAAPGTTRDMVEARGEVRGIPVYFQDTAGIRRGASRVEQMGIERSHAVTQKADLVVLVLDGASPSLAAAATEALEVVDAAHDPLIVLNKTDLAGWRNLDVSAAVGDGERIPTSVITGEGMSRLIEAMGNRLEGESHKETALLTTARQHRVVSDTLSHVEEARRMLLGGYELELVAVELRWAREDLAALLGRSATDDMLTALFSEFCIGK